LKLVNEENLNIVFSEEIKIPVLAQDPTTLIDQFGENNDLESLSECALIFGIHYGIVAKLVDKILDPLYRSVFLLFICSYPSFLDIIHIHGKTLELIEQLFRIIKDLFEEYEKEEKKENNTEAAIKLHDSFSHAFSALFLAVQRFQIIRIDSNRKQFLHSMNEHMKSENDAVQDSLSKVSRWIYGWCHDMDMLPVTNQNISINEEVMSPCPIGDELICALLDLQTQQPQLNENQEAPLLDFDKLQDIKTRYPPSYILEVTPYIVEQCHHAYTEKGMNVLVSTQMLGFFVNFFGQIAYA
jgi:hypothetical protein